MFVGSSPSTALCGAALALNHHPAHRNFAAEIGLREDLFMDLGELDDALSRRARAWHAAEVRWEILRWRLTDKPASSLRVEKDDALAELILWVSGEAELIYTRRIEDPPKSEHYEITTAVGLNGILDDLEAHIGLRALPNLQPVLPFPDDEPPRA